MLSARKHKRRAWRGKLAAAVRYWRGYGGSVTRGSPTQDWRDAIYYHGWQRGWMNPGPDCPF